VPDGCAARRGALRDDRRISVGTDARCRRTRPASGRFGAPWGQVTGPADD
jgi:hypothetical protein